MADERLANDVPQLSIISDASRVIAEAERRTVKHPKGWEPGVAFDGQSGVISTGPRSEPSAPSDNEWLDLLAIWNLDPEVYEVDPDYNPEFRAWDANIGGGEVQRFYYYKARIRLRHQRYGIDIDEVLDGIRRWKRLKAVPTGPHSLVVPLSDWQIGKALADDTPVLTPSGWTTHGELRPGDYVFGPDGHPKMVTAVTGSTMQECYAVEFDGGVSLVASGEHRWAGWRRYKDSDGSYGRRRLTWTTEQIAALVPTIRGGRRYVERAFHVDLPAAIQAPPVELPIDPYLLGVWLGGGNRHTGRFTTSVEDVDHWVDQFGALATIHGVADKDNTVDVRVDGLTASLRAVGSLGSKNIPLGYLGGSVDQRLSLLQGLMDTDGRAMGGGRVEFTNTDGGLADAVAWLATSLGMKVSRSEKRGTLNGAPKKWVYRVWFRPDASRDDHQVFRMKRKVVRLREAASDQSRFRFVQRVEPIGLVSAQCISVEGGLYLAGRDLVVTHNSDGDGVRGTVDRIMTSFDRLEDVIDELKRSKVGLECLYLIGMGDLIEQCTGNYPAQAFTTELNRREQLRLTFRCMRDGAARLSRKLDRMVVGGVAGNHGENRLDGKLYTTPGDNDDLLVIEMVANALLENDEAFGHVSFVIPEEKLWLVLDISGVPVGFTHGHQAGRGATPQQKQKEWLKDMAFGDHDIGQARIVVTGHYHHLSVIDHGPKVHIQCPAMDGGSRWWINRTGADSSPGTVCFVVSSEYRMGFDHLRVV